jgi:hypothetical protein
MWKLSARKRPDKKGYCVFYEFDWSETGRFAHAMFLHYMRKHASELVKHDGLLLWATRAEARRGVKAMEAFIRSSLA